MNTQNDTLPIESRMLTGLTVKTALALVGGLISILVSVVTSYASIINKLDRTQEAVLEMRRNKELTDMQLKALEVQLQTVEIRLVRLETQMKEKEGP